MTTSDTEPRSGTKDEDQADSTVGISALTGGHESSSSASNDQIEGSQFLTARVKQERRKSQLPAGTRDPLFPGGSLGEPILILSAKDEHLISGFDTSYPACLVNHCTVDIWTAFIADINRSARLRRKHKLVLCLVPLAGRSKVVRRVMENQMKSRKKPVVTMLKYWQDIMKTYGLQVELAQGGVPVSTSSLPRRSTSHSDISPNSNPSVSQSELTNSVDTVKRRSFAVARSRSSSISGQEYVTPRVPFQHANGSHISLATSFGMSNDSPGSITTGNWQIVVRSMLRRSHVQSMYSRSRRFSTLSARQFRHSVHQNRSGTTTGNDQMAGLHVLHHRKSAPLERTHGTGRSRVLSLEELANLPLPTPRDPFTGRIRVDEPAMNILVDSESSASNMTDLDHPSVPFEADKQVPSKKMTVLLGERNNASDMPMLATSPTKVLRQILPNKASNRDPASLTSPTSIAVTNVEMDKVREQASHCSERSPSTPVKKSSHLTMNTQTPSRGSRRNVDAQDRECSVSSHELTSSPMRQSSGSFVRSPLGSNSTTADSLNMGASVTSKTGISGLLSLAQATFVRPFYNRSILQKASKNSLKIDVVQEKPELNLPTDPTAESTRLCVETKSPTTVILQEIVSESISMSETKHSELGASDQVFVSVAVSGS